MGSTYLLKNLSHEGLVALLGRRVPELDVPSVEAYTTLMRVAGAILEDGDAQLQRHGTTQARLRVLAQARIAGEAGVTPAAVAARLGIARATVTRLLDGLEAERLLERVPSERDGRSLTIRLTEKGAALVDRILPERVRRVQRLLAGLSSGEKKRLVALLRKLEAGMREAGA